ncbi:MAG TPA: protein kinase [Oscillatoriaceae cyanobacterium M33_DOE_052]|uniref:VWA domain-containing protein n=1 Tax=Planktothricoides sp. SpSt-374 TaxID=2282167 RepID=A0A7C3VFZ4_9CYAN|nr:protein kinase [Oscillatoriaceae cyanobacterium M33_DOE_052]
MHKYHYCLNPGCQNPKNPAGVEVCASCGADLLIGDRYRAVKPIGQGGMGRTYLAVDASEGQKRCVIKQFFPQNGQNREKAAELFREEAQHLEELGHHPQIPQLLGYFEENGSQYLVQEYISGISLAAELINEGAFDEAKIRQLLNDLLPLLQFIHNHGVIHRDIKPENIIRSYKNRLVLVDFGAAKFTTATSLGKTGTVIGSAAYTAPEQVRGKAVFSSDLYSLAVTSIHLMTMVPPFDLFDNSRGVWIWREYLKAPVSKPLGQVLDKMLPSATGMRYESALTAFNDLQQSPGVGKIVLPKVGLLGGLLGTALAVTVVNNFLISPSRYVPPASPPTLQEPIAVAPVPQPTVAVPNIGGLYGQTEDGKEETFPLKHTEVSAKISGNVSRVEVVQSFANPYNLPLEAIYKFPLPDEAAVDDMEIRIGDRVIKANIKKREEAQQIYQQAKQQGQTAALLEQERPNIFTQSVANIRPGETIEIVIRYTDSLPFDSGDYEFVFPMVVGPRYIPGGANQAATNTALNPPIAISNMRSGSDINVTVEIDAGVPIWDIKSPSHQIQTQQIQTGNTTHPLTQVRLSDADTIPNKDLVLRYRVAGAKTESTVLTHADNRGGHFGVYLIPGLEYQTNEIVPKDIVFLMDTSGSQSGPPIAQSKALMQRFINGLNPLDTFTIIDFANSAQALSRKPLPNTAENRQKALNYIDRLDANGGTELLNGINTVMNFPPAPEGRLRSIVLLTDGLIGNDEEIIGMIQQNLKPGNRLYSFGVGSSVNRFLIDRLAEVGRGISYTVLDSEPIDEVTAKFFSQINNPVLTNIEVSWEGMGEAPEIYPLKAPDLFAEQPLVLFGRKQDRLSGNLKITGVAAGGKPYQKTYFLKFDENQGNSAIAQLWGRAKIKEMMTQMMGVGETQAGINAVTDIALSYRLMSKYTSFVAVSEEVRVNPNAPSITEKVPVPTTPSPTSQTTGSTGSSNVHAAPEPSFMLATLSFGAFLGWKKRQMSRKNRDTES